MASKLRPTKFHDPNRHPNCSVVHVIDNEVYVFNNRLYYVTYNNNPIDYKAAGGFATFFINDGRGTSLNQDPGAPRSDYHILKLPLNIAYEVFHAFSEIDKENERRVQTL